MNYYYCLWIIQAIVLFDAGLYLYCEMTRRYAIQFNKDLYLKTTAQTNLIFSFEQVNNLIMHKKNHKIWGWAINDQHFLRSIVVNWLLKYERKRKFYSSVTTWWLKRVPSCPRVCLCNTALNLYRKSLR